MGAWNECTLWDECIDSEHMTVCNECTECSSICKFSYITRPITVIGHDHTIHRVIAYDTQPSTYDTGSQSFTCHIDSQVTHVIHVSIMWSIYKNITHPIYITFMFAHLLELYEIVNKNTLGLAKQPHSANSTRLSRVTSLPRLLSTQLVSRIFHNIYFTSHRYTQSLWVPTHTALKQFNIITSLPHIRYSLNSLYISCTFILCLQTLESFPKVTISNHLHSNQYICECITVNPMP